MSQGTDSPKTYIAVFLALMGLTALTVGAAFVNFGPFNVVIALGIAILKATLVLWFFMHVRHAGTLTKIFVATGFYWLLILLGFTLADYKSRAWESFPHSESWVTQNASHFAAKLPAAGEAAHH